MEKEKPNPLIEYRTPDLSGRMRSGWLIAVTGSAASWSIGFFLAVFVANVYERVMYPPEPDPVHFDVAAVMLIAWVIIGMGGTAFFGLGSFRGRRAGR